jgi:hypothetical protein
MRRMEKDKMDQWLRQLSSRKPEVYLYPAAMKR